MPRRNIRLQGRDWSHLSPRVVEELHDVISALGPLRSPPRPWKERALLCLVHDTTRAEKHRLAAHYELKDRNIKLVLDFAPIFCGRGVEPGDLISEGMIALDWAVQKWSPRKLNPKSGRPYRLTTYVSWWIRKGCQDAQRSRGSLFTPNGHTVHEMDGFEDFDPSEVLPPDADEDIERMRDALDALHPRTALILRRRNNTPPDTYKQLAIDLKVSETAIHQAEEMGLKILRLRLENPNGERT